MGNVLLQLLVNGLMKGGVYGLLALGLTIIYGVVQILNFAHGDYVMLAMYSAFFLYTLAGVSPFVGLFIIVPLFFLIGVIMYKILFKRMVGKNGYIQVFTTTGLSMIIQNVVLIFLSSNPRKISMPGLSKVLKLGSIRASLVETIGFLVAVVLMAGLFIFLQYSFTGKSIRAVIDQRRGAALVGINVNAMYQLAIAIGFGCVGAAGTILVTLYNVTPAVGQTWTTVAFIAVVLGGFSSLPGSLIAAVLIGWIEAFSGYFFSVQLKEVAYFAIFLVVLYFCPQGLFGKKRS